MKSNKTDTTYHNRDGVSALVRYQKTLPAMQSTIPIRVRKRGPVNATREIVIRKRAGTASYVATVESGFATQGKREPQRAQENDRREIHHHDSLGSCTQQRGLVEKKGKRMDGW
jgi:hypothetical protein